MTSQCGRRDSTVSYPEGIGFLVVLSAICSGLDGQLKSEQERADAPGQNVFPCGKLLEFRKQDMFCCPPGLSKGIFSIVTISHEGGERGEEDGCRQGPNMEDGRGRSMEQRRGGKSL